MAKGRRAQLEDTTPGKILALALLANAPVLVAFVLVPLFSGGDTLAARRYSVGVLWITPLFAVLSLGVFARARPERRQHRAARIGALLAVVGLFLWALVLYASARAP